MLLSLKTNRRKSRKRRQMAGPRSANPLRGKRRGATAMEYVVVASFIFAVIFVAIQHFGSVVGSSFQDSAQKLPSGK